MERLYGRDKDHKYVQEMRAQLIGEVGLELTHEYTMEMIIHSLPGGQLEWQAMTLQDKGRRVSAISLQNKVRTIERAEDILRHNQKMLATRQARQNASKEKQT
jgi:hypothetical protein